MLRRDAGCLGDCRSLLIVEAGELAALVIVGEDLVVGEAGEAHGGGSYLAEAYAVAPAVAVEEVRGLREEGRGGRNFLNLEPTALEMAGGEDLADEEFFADDDGGRCLVGSGRRSDDA